MAYEYWIPVVLDVSNATLAWYRQGLSSDWGCGSVMRWTCALGDR
jgi:hypothetical protein